MVQLTQCLFKIISGKVSQSSFVKKEYIATKQSLPLGRLSQLPLMAIQTSTESVWITWGQQDWLLFLTAAKIALHQHILRMSQPVTLKLHTTLNGQRSNGFITHLRENSEMFEAKGKMSTTCPTRNQLLTSFWCSSNHKWHTVHTQRKNCSMQQAELCSSNMSGLMSCQRKHARSLHSPSPAPSPGWPGPLYSAGFPRWRTRTSSPTCCCSSCSWHLAPCVFLWAWPCLAPHSAADLQPGVQVK